MAGEAFINRLDRRSGHSPAPHVLRSHRGGSPPARRGGARQRCAATSTTMASTSSSPKSSAAPSTCGSTGSSDSGVALEAVRHDLEEALRGGLVGFQELVVGDRATARTVELLQVGGLRRAQRPVYRRVVRGTTSRRGTVKAVDVDGLADPHRQRRRRASTPSPTSAATARCRCSSARSRAPSSAAAGTAAATTCGPANGSTAPERLAVFPVAVEDDEVRVAVGVEPVAQA